jgi:hypothetical protein
LVLKGKVAVLRCPWACHRCATSDHILKALQSCHRDALILWNSVHLRCTLSASVLSWLPAISILCACRRADLQSRVQEKETRSTGNIEANILPLVIETAAVLKLLAQFYKELLVSDNFTNSMYCYLPIKN